jgi:hypothetical protein
MMQGVLMLNTVLTGMIISSIRTKDLLPPIGSYQNQQP